MNRESQEVIRRGDVAIAKARQLVDELAQRRSARSTTIPKADRAAFFAPKTDWLARNEAVALALGRAQIAARAMDDQRIEVLSVRVSGDTAVLTLSRAPDQSSVHGATTLRPCMGEGWRGTALVGHGEHAVLVEWLL